MFFRHRESRMCKRLHEIAVASPSELVAMVGCAWRRYHGQSCRGVRWCPVKQLPAPARTAHALDTGFGSKPSSGHGDGGVGSQGSGGGVDAVSAGSSHRVEGANGGAGRWNGATLYHLHLLQLVAACMGGVGLAAVFNTLAADHKHFQGGMPDLLLWRSVRRNAGGAGSHTAVPIPAATPRVTFDGGLHSMAASDTVDTPVSGGTSYVVDVGDEAEGIPVSAAPDIELDTTRYAFEAMLVEVKGPRDRLSDKQRAWIAALRQGGVAVEVFRVFEPGQHAPAIR